MPCLSIEAKRRIVSLHSCSKALLNIYISMFLALLLHLCLTIPCVVHCKLYKMCMFHAMRKRGPHKHIVRMNCRFVMAPRMDMCVTMKLKLSSTVHVA